MSTLNSEPAVQIARPIMSKAPTVIAAACLCVIAALVLGVGLASNLVLRHLVQTLPLWASVVLGFRRSRLTGWIALPCFLFWLFLMGVIWCFLLGLSHWITGHFSATEITMTIIVGIASLVGIVAFVRFRSSVHAGIAALLFVGTGAVQFACFRISFLPSIAHR